MRRIERMLLDLWYTGESLLPSTSKLRRFMDDYNALLEEMFKSKHITWTEYDFLLRKTKSDYDEKWEKQEVHYEKTIKKRTF